MPTSGSTARILRFTFRIEPALMLRAATTLFPNRTRTGTSAATIRFSGEPSAISICRMSRTSFLRPMGSSDAAWSGPGNVRSLVK